MTSHDTLTYSHCSYQRSPSTIPVVLWAALKPVSLFETHEVSIHPFHTKSNPEVETYQVERHSPVDFVANRAGHPFVAVVIPDLISISTNAIVPRCQTSIICTSSVLVASIQPLRGTSRVLLVANERSSSSIAGSTTYRPTTRKAPGARRSILVVGTGGLCL